jgi:acyl dehydratase
MPITIEKSQINDYINKQLDVTDWFQVTQEQIDTFADCTLDRQFIHVDSKAALKNLLVLRLPMGS